MPDLSLILQLISNQMSMLYYCCISLVIPLLIHIPSLKRLQFRYYLPLDGRIQSQADNNIHSLMIPLKRIH